MEFDINKVYTAIDSDKLEVGDKVIVGNTLYNLKYNVEHNKPVNEIGFIKPDNDIFRFEIKGGNTFALVYLVKRARNCTNCTHRYSERCKPNVSPINCCPCYDREVKQSYIEPKTEQKAEPHYRPFKDTDELIKVWNAKIGIPKCLQTDDALTKPYIWVQRKGMDTKELITGFDKECMEQVKINGVWIDMQALFNIYTFLDGTVCGVLVEE